MGARPGWSRCASAEPCPARPAGRRSAAFRWFRRFCRWFDERRKRACRKREKSCRAFAGGSFLPVAVPCASEHRPLERRPWPTASPWAPWSPWILWRSPWPLCPGGPRPQNAWSCPRAHRPPGARSRRRGRPRWNGARGRSPRRRTTGRRPFDASSCAAECRLPFVPLPYERLYRCYPLRPARPRRSEVKFSQKLRSRGQHASLSRIPRCSPTQMEARMRARTQVRPASVASSSRSSGWSE